MLPESDHSLLLKQLLQGSPKPTFSYWQIMAQYVECCRDDWQSSVFTQSNGKRVAPIYYRVDSLRNGKHQKPGYSWTPMHNINKTQSSHTFNKQAKVDAFRCGVQSHHRYKLLEQIWFIQHLNFESGCGLISALLSPHTKKREEIRRLMLLEQSEPAGLLGVLTQCCFKSAEMKSLQR